MKLRTWVVAILLATVAWVVWRSQLWTVSRPGAAPAPLIVREPAARSPIALDTTLPSVPVGMEHLASGRSVLLIHYWAPWEHASRAQAAMLDSLHQLPEMQGLRVVVVCFDPFPSVARFVARQRLRLSVLIDGHGTLRAALPCPSIPYTYVLDASGRVAVAQPGEVDWLAAETRAVLQTLMREAEVPPSPTVRRASSASTPASS